MKRFLYLSSLVLLLVVVGCGGSTIMGGLPPSPTPTPAGSGMNGNFGMSAVSTGPDIFSIGGAFQTANGSVTGTVRVDSSTSKCFDFFTPLTFAGTISSDDHLSMTSSSFQSQTINVTGVLSSDGKSISGGTFLVIGGCGSGIHGTLSGFQVPTVNGTFSGSFMAGGATIGMVATLTQGNSPNNFLLSGTANFSNGSACGLTTGKFVGGETGFIAGADVRAMMLDPSLVPEAFFGGFISDGTGKTINGALTINSGPCSGTSIPITLTMVLT